MFSHTKQFQYNAKLDALDPVFAKQMGRWAEGPSMDGKGQFEYVADPQATGPQMEELNPPVEPRLYSTPKQPMQPSSS